MVGQRATYQAAQEWPGQEFHPRRGLPPPARWTIDQRKLPDDTVANGIREILRNGLTSASPSLPGGVLKAALLVLAAGRVGKNLFPMTLLMTCPNMSL